MDARISDFGISVLKNINSANFTEDLNNNQEEDKSATAEDNITSVVYCGKLIYQVIESSDSNQFLRKFEELDIK